MMRRVNEDISNLLMAADTPIDWDYPPDFDWQAQWVRIENLLPTLEQIAGQPFEIDRTVQDASYQTSLYIERRKTPTSDRSAFVLRFSNFGAFFTAYNVAPGAWLPDEVTEALIQAVSEASFQYIPRAALDTPYTGDHTGFADSTWW